MPDTLEENGDSFLMTIKNTYVIRRAAVALTHLNSKTLLDAEFSVELFLNCSRLEDEMIDLEEEEELLLRCLLADSGSATLPNRLAKRDKISVKLMTPINLPGLAASFSMRYCGICWNCGEAEFVFTFEEADEVEDSDDTDEEPAGFTIHNLCACVATNLAIVRPNEEFGVTWKIGKESLPFSNPREFRMMDMK